MNIFRITEGMIEIVALDIFLITAEDQVDPVG